MAVSTLAPQIKAPTKVTSGSNKGWTYSVIGGLFIGTYAGEFSNLAVTSPNNGMYQSDQKSIDLPVTLDGDTVAFSGIATPAVFMSNFGAYGLSVKFRFYSANSRTVNTSFLITCIGKVA
ncbi:MAG: hypothetical protein IJH75_01740 [Mogibacterium sp.]|nr:hypothetical protein [Mogibacterium sp.]